MNSTSNAKASEDRTLGARPGEDVTPAEAMLSEPACPSRPVPAAPPPDPFADPSSFEFFQLVRRLERVAWRTADTLPREQRQQLISARQEQADSSRSPIRFRAVASLAFPPGEVSAIHEETSPEGLPNWLVEVTFMGLIGPTGVLPPHISSLLLRQGEARRAALRDFLSVFEHRFITGFYRAWEKSRNLFAFERAVRQEHDDATDPFTHAIQCLVGLGMADQRQRLKISSRLPLFYAGHFSNAVRPAGNLQRVIQEAFGIPAAVEEFIGAWLVIPARQRTRLGSSVRPRADGGNRRLDDQFNARLGATFCAGSRTWSVQDRFRIRLGPLDSQTFQRLTPAGDLHPILCDLVRLYAGTQLDFEIQPVLRADSVPKFQLLSGERAMSRLGWNTWLKLQPFRLPATQAVFRAKAEQMEPKNTLFPVLRAESRGDKL